MHHMWFNIRDKGEQQPKSLNFASDQVSGSASMNLSMGIV